VEPVEHVLGLGVQVERHLAHVLSSVGQEGDLLVGLHPLRLEELEKAALGPGVVCLDEAEAPGRALRRHALARDHLEPALPLRPMCAGVHVPAIEAHGQRQLGSGQLVPLPLAALDADRLLRFQLVLEPLRRSLEVAPHRARFKGTAEGQELSQQLGAEPVGGQPRELGFQVQQLTLLFRLDVLKRCA
jgi:hypothetical protein